MERLLRGIGQSVGCASADCKVCAQNSPPKLKAEEDAPKAGAAVAPPKPKADELAGAPKAGADVAPKAGAEEAPNPPANKDSLVASTALRPPFTHGAWADKLCAQVPDMCTKDHYSRECRLMLAGGDCPHQRQEH